MRKYCTIPFGMFLTIVLLLPTVARAQELYVSPQQDVLNRLSSSVENMTGKDVIGDTINHQTGDLSFRHVDIVLKGHGPEIAISRSFQVSARSAWNWRHNREFADWDLEIPSISTTTTMGSNDWKVVGANPTARCTSFGPAANIGSFTANYWWQGVHLNVPGASRQELMTRASENTYLPQVAINGVVPSFNIVTRDNWAITCLSTLKDGVPGEGFLAISPEGTKYWFDKMVYRFESYESETAWTNLMRTAKWKASLYVTRIEDRFGNYVTYNYQNNRLSTITSSDGRALQVYWSANRGNSLGEAYHIERIVTQPGTTLARTWTYSYLYRGIQNGTNVMPRWDLQTLTLPDASSWTFSIGPFSNSCYDSRDAPGCSWATPTGISGSIKSPSGVTGTFKIKNGTPIRQGQYAIAPPAVPWASSNVQLLEMDPRNVDSPRVVEKKLTGPAIDYTWSYSYDGKILEPGALISPRMQIVNPDGTLDDVYVDGAWGSPTEGQVMRIEKFAGPTSYTPSTGYVGNGPARQVESFLYRAAQSRVGTVPRTNSNALGQEFRWPLRKQTKLLDGVTFTTEITGFDSFDRPTQIQRSNSSGYARTDGLGYHDDPNVWALGQQSSQTINGVQVRRVDFGWKALPWKLYSFGRLTETRAYNSTATVASRQLGTLASIVDGQGNTTNYGDWYRGIPRLTSFPATPDAPAGATKQILVDDNGLITAITDESGSVTGYGYDAAGRLAAIIYPTGDSAVWYNTTIAFQPVSVAEYGVAAGHWKQTTTTGNSKREVIYDGLWRPVLTREFDATSAAVTTATQRFRSRAYNYRGQVTFASYPGTTSALTAGTLTTYDALGRNTVTSYSIESTPSNSTGQAQVITEYLPNLSRRVTAPNLAQTTTSYLMYDEPTYEWPTAIAAPEGAFTDISRDVYGKPTALTRRNAGGSTTSTRRYVYRPDYQSLCKTIDPESGAQIQDYDASGNLLWTFRSAGSTSATDCSFSDAVVSGRITRTYDARNRLSTITHPDGVGDQIWSYTPDGKTSQILTYSYLGSTTPTVNSYAYNKRRLLVGESLGTQSVGYAYDRHGALSTQVYPSGLSISYLPNALGQAKEVRDSTGFGYITNVSYHPDGSPKQFTYGNGIQRNATTNLRGLPLRITDSLGGVKPLDIEYAYDPSGNIGSIVDHSTSARQARQMTYDGLERLKNTTSPMFGTANYSYDVLDNVTEMNVSGGGSARTYSYVYDTPTNRLMSIKQGPAGPTVVGYGYDVAGNIINKNGVVNEFDAAGKLRLVTGKEVGYIYDGHGRRIMAASGYMNPRFRNFLYGESGQLLYSSSTGGGYTEHLYLSGVNVASRSMSVGIPGALPITSYRHADAAGTSLASSDATGSIASTSEYEPFGQLVNRAPINEIGFTGHMNDASTGFTYMQQRYYDPMVGRFLSPDPVAVNSDTGLNFNRYAYANNNPFKYVDPDGRDAFFFTDVRVLVIPVYFTGPDANDKNIQLIQERASQIQTEFGAPLKVVVLPRDAPGPGTNTLELGPYFGSMGWTGEASNAFGGNKAQINTALANWVGAALHDLLHLAGAPEGYTDRGGTRENRNPVSPRPGYNNRHIMFTRDGVYLRMEDVEMILENESTRKRELKDHKKDKEIETRSE